MTFDERAREAARLAWGFVPGRDIKPVHLANGLAREACGGTGTPTLLHRVASGQRRTGHAPDDLLVDPDFRACARAEAEGTSRLDPARVAELRRALDAVLNQDRALNAPNSPSALTLTHRLHVTSDPSDSRAGAFLAALLAAAPASPLLGALRARLDAGGDTVSRLTGPLLNREHPLGLAPEADTATAAVLAASPALQAARVGFDRLAAYADELDKTAFLQRVVAFGAFALVLHLVNRRTAARPNRLLPLLLTGPDPRDEVRAASRRAWALVGREVRLAHEEGLRDLCARDGEHEGDAAFYRTLVETEAVETGKKAQRDAARKAKAFFAAAFDRYLDLGLTPFEAYLRAAVGPMGVVMRPGGMAPEDCAYALARRCGLQWPRRYGRGERYCRPDPRLLDALVAALLEPDEVVTAAEFWARAWEQFGLLSGDAGDFGQTDAAHLSAWGVRAASADALAANGQAVLAELDRLGYARRYADGVTLLSARP